MKQSPLDRVFLKMATIDRNRKIKETGIIMSTPMMIADLANRKTMTRRIWGLSKINEVPNDWECKGYVTFTDALWRFDNKINGDIKIVKCPYGGIGDSIYCKETWRLDDTFKGGGIPRLGIRYGEGVEWKANNPNQSGKWKPSMFMPKWASRRSHILTNIRCERVQDITGEDAIREGMIVYITDKFARGEWYKLDKEGILNNIGLTKPDYRNAYRVLWDELNAKRGYPWDKNCFVWVLEWAK